MLLSFINGSKDQPQTDEREDPVEILLELEDGEYLNVGKHMEMTNSQSYPTSDDSGFNTPSRKTSEHVKPSFLTTSRSLSPFPQIYNRSKSVSPSKRQRNIVHKSPLHKLFAKNKSDSQKNLLKSPDESLFRGLRGRSKGKTLNEINCNTLDFDEISTHEGAESVIEEDGRINYIPKCDARVWIRSCTKPNWSPLHGNKHGTIPKWLRGSVIRNGPGRIQVGDDTYQHIFDGSALLHRFHICDGQVTYQNRFLESKNYKRDTESNRIVVNYFGTKAHPDPCKTIMQNIASKFVLEDQLGDNAQISVYPYGDGLYTLTESPYMYRIDPKTLQTMEKVNLNKFAAIYTHTAHPHVAPNGTVYNLGQGATIKGPVHHICEFPAPPKSEKGNLSYPFEKAKIVGSIKSRWFMHPSYMHSFCITQNYFVIIEQPLVVSVPKAVKGILKQDPFIHSLEWYDKDTRIHVVNRITGKPHTITYQTDTFFFLHTINAYEYKGHIVMDVAAYKDPKMLECMYVESLKNASYNPNYARMFRGRPKRWVLPLTPSRNVAKGSNLVSMKNTQCIAHWVNKTTIQLEPELLANIGCEVPRINYESNNGLPYQYFYAICSDVDHPSPGTLIKVDVINKTHVEWTEENVYPSEPIFVSEPGATDEDSGVILSALLRCQGLDNQVCLLVLDAKTFKEIGRVEFECEGPVPKCLHGWFVNDDKSAVERE